MVAAGDVGFRATDFIQVGQERWGDLTDIQGFAADSDLLIGNDISGGAFIAQLMLVVVTLDLIDHAFVKGPGV